MKKKDTNGPTIAVTLMIPIRWKEELEKLARKMSAKYDYNITYTDLIRNSLGYTWFDYEGMMASVNRYLQFREQGKDPWDFP